MSGLSSQKDKHAQLECLRGSTVSSTSSSSSLSAHSPRLMATHTAQYHKQQEPEHPSNCVAYESGSGACVRACCMHDNNGYIMLLLRAFRGVNDVRCSAALMLATRHMHTRGLVSVVRVNWARQKTHQNPQPKVCSVHCAKDDL